MDIALRYAARSHVGLVRSNNQDSGYAGPYLLMVADGMGGHAGGDVASAIAVRSLVHLDVEPNGAENALRELEASIEAAHQEIIDQTAAHPELAGMGTTVTALLRTGSSLVMAHLGDSRAYLLRDGELAQITIDHTFVQHLVDTGRITLDEAETHPQRNVVMRVLGDFDIDLTPDTSVREARLGDRWLLCSDGLSGFVSAEVLTQVLTDHPDVDECADLLVELAMEAGSTDNITAIVAEVVPADQVTGEQYAELVGSAAVTDPAQTGPVTADGTAGAAAPRDAWPFPGVEGTAGDAAEHNEAPDPRGAPAGDAPDAAAGEATEPAGDATEHPGDDTAETRTAATPGPTGEDGADAATVGVAETDEAIDADGAVGDADDEPPRRRRLGWLIAIVVVLVVAAVGWGGYAWTQSQYYLGVADDGNIAIYQGIDANAGPIHLSELVEETSVSVTDLPAYAAQRVRETIPASSLADARDRARTLADEAAAETPSPTVATPSIPAGKVTPSTGAG